jgi:hypothetical protein
MRYHQAIVFMGMIFFLNLSWGLDFACSSKPGNANVRSLTGTLIPAEPEGSDPEQVVRIHPNTVKDIGGYTRVQEIFGIMSGNIDLRALPYLRDANIQAIRNIINWLPRPGEFGYERGSIEWYDDFMQRDPYPLWEQILNKPALRRYFDDSYGPVSIGICTNPELFDQKLERNPEGARKHMDAFIAALKNLESPDKESALKYAQLYNEPETWTDAFDGNHKLASDAYTRVYNALYDFIKQQHPDIIFPANCIGHNHAYNLDTGSEKKNWGVWVKYFIDHVDNPRSLNYFNAHAYSIPTLRNLAFASMTQNYAEQTRGFKPRFLLTEISSPAPEDASRAENYRKLFTFHANDLFMMLHHPDKYALRIAFTAAPGRKHSFFNVIEGELVPEASYYVYRTFQNLRGTNLHYSSNNDHIRAFASSPGQDKLVIGLFNPTHATQSIQLDPGIAEGQISRIIRRKAVFQQSISNAAYTEGEVNISFPYAMELEPRSTYAIEIDLNEHLEREHTVKTREFYGSRVRTEMEDSVKLNISIPYIPDKNGQAFLKMATYTKQESGSFTFLLNGKAYTANWEDAPDKTVPAWNSMVGYFKIPIDKQDIQKENQLVIEPLSGNILLFSSIVFDLYSYEHR